jgi:hypothetical protein
VSALGVGPGDPLYDLFQQAEDALRRLAAELHDRSIVCGDRRPRGPGEGF